MSEPQFPTHPNSTPDGGIEPLAQQFATRRARREWERRHPNEAFPGIPAPREPEASEDPSASAAVAQTVPASGAQTETEPLPQEPGVSNPSQQIPGDFANEAEGSQGQPPAGPADELALWREPLAALDVRDADPSLDSDPEEQEEPEGKHPRRRGWIVAVVSIAIALALILSGLFFARGMISSLTQSDDYQGAGTGSVLFTITEGDTGSTIASNLVKAHIIKSYRPFLDASNQTSPSPVFMPGAYKLRHKMSAARALNVLKDKNNIVSATVVIPEGFTEAQVLARVAARTGLRLNTLKETAAKVTDFGLSASAPSLEGYLFPATYQFKPGVTATQVLTTMVQRTRTALTQAGVSWENAPTVLTLASIVQKEAGSTEDMPKVARVFQNRLDQGMKLQSDATVSYGAGSSSITTTAAQRADASNKYNTYANAGLPIGPISNPGDAAIAAAVSPAAGSWLYFTTVNPTTGETRFEDTAAEHEQNVKIFQQWLKEHGSE
ncbi:MAG: endolytic transglycosylase MltG [Microbacteriaceae bacterium]|jgi:UPF0755 protein|nr:endolytic transglycosylase MltG [Microbacteriaceae bacterium]